MLFRKMWGGVGHACKCVWMCEPVLTQAEARAAEAGSCQERPVSSLEASSQHTFSEDMASTTLNSPLLFP